MSAKAAFRNPDARKQFIHKMNKKWEHKYQQAMRRLPADEGFKYFEYLDE